MSDDERDDKSSGESGAAVGDQTAGSADDIQIDDQPDARADTPPASDQPAGPVDGKAADDPQGGQPEARAGDSDQPSGDAAEQPALAPAPARPYGVESWRPLVAEMAGDIPVEVLLRWIKHESGGNPCSTGKIVNGASIENGLFQLYSPDDDHLATPAQLHGSFCSGQTCVRDLNLQEARVQVASGIAYVRICRDRARAQLKQGGVSWDETGSDFWALVKMQHNLPSVPKIYIPRLQPSTWAEFKEGVINDQPKYKGSTIFSNAEDIGAAAG